MGRGRGPLVSFNVRDSKAMHSPVLGIFLRVLFSIKESLCKRVGRNHIARSIADSGGNSLEEVQYNR